MLLSIYDELEGPRKAEIDDMADFISARDNEVAHVFALSGLSPSTMEEGVSQMKVESLLVMPRNQMPPEVNDHVTGLLHTLGMRASSEEHMTVLVRFQKPEGDEPPEVSCLTWSGGAWRDAGEETTARLLFGTNIGDIMGIGYGDGMNFRPAYKPSRQNGIG